MPSILEHLLCCSIFYLVLWEEPVMLLRFLCNTFDSTYLRRDFLYKILPKSVELFARVCWCYTELVGANTLTEGLPRRLTRKPRAAGDSRPVEATYHLVGRGHRPRWQSRLNESRSALISRAPFDYPLPSSSRGGFT